MMIGRKFAIDRFGFGDEATLPFDNLDQNFVATDALITKVPSPADSSDLSNPQISNLGSLPSHIQTPWPKADVIIGNPPFLGAKRLKPEHGADYANALRKLYPEVPGMADFCVYWIRRAHDHLPACTKSDPFAGLVGTQNVRNNQSRVGGLDHVVKTGTIIEAVDNQPWSGDANVHVSITSWMKTQEPSLVPKKRLLWQKAQPTPGAKRKHGVLASKDYELTRVECPSISATLSDQTDVAEVFDLHANCCPQVVFNGQYPRHEGFRVDPDTAQRWIADDPRVAEVVHPFLIGAVMLTAGKPDQWIIDFQARPITEAQSYRQPFAQVQTKVLPHIQALADAEKAKSGKTTGQDQNWLQTWWRHFRARAEMHAAIGARRRYIVCCEVTKRPTFCFVDTFIRPDKTLEAFALDDDYSFGILQSAAHWLWFTTKCSKLTERFRYTPESVFDTFPWPQSPTRKQIDAVAAAGREVRRVRADALSRLSGGLRALYRTLELPGRHPLKDAHAALDQAVLAAYTFSPKQDFLAQLLDLNHTVAAKEKAGTLADVTAPGIPATYGSDAKALITDDCIRP